MYYVMYWECPRERVDIADCLCGPVFFDSERGATMFLWESYVKPRIEDVDLFETLVEMVEDTVIGIPQITDYASIQIRGYGFVRYFLDAYFEYMNDEQCAAGFTIAEVSLTKA